MGFLDKYAFPNQVIYNATNKEGGGNCSGSANVLPIKNIEKEKENDEMFDEKNENLKTTTLHA